MQEVIVLMNETSVVVNRKVSDSVEVIIWQVQV